MAGSAAKDYRAKTAHELSALAREMKSNGHPAPLGDPLSGVVVVIEAPIGPRILDAVSRSLEAVGAPDAYATFTSTGLLGKELSLAEPRVLAAIGPDAATEIDGLSHPLAANPFSKAEEGVPFAWKRATTGLLLPPLSQALDDEQEKRRFWHAFLALKGRI